MCPLAACRNGEGYRSIEAFKCYCGSLLTPSFRRAVDRRKLGVNKEPQLHLKASIDLYPTF